jgi:molybdenum cofactor cytidylyltransferase
MIDNSREILSVACVILAAGAARRMGRLKQLLPYGGGTLLWNAIDTARDAAFGPVIVVVGAEADRVRQAIAHKDVIVAENPEWSTGMGSSIAAGIRSLLESEEPVDAVALILADQPKITARHLSAMRSVLQTSDGDAVAAEYSGTIGVPALFRASVMQALAGLPAATGAKQLLTDGGLRVEHYPLPEAAVDIDTPEDLASL